MDDKYFDIAQLVGKYLANDLTNSERIRLMKWVELSEVNRLWFHSVTESNFVRLKRQNLKSVDIDQGWIALLKKKRQEYKRALYLQVLKYVGIFIIPVLLGVYVFMHVKEHQVIDVPVMQEILPGSHRAILQMADGSSIVLHPQLEEIVKEKDGTLIDLKGECVTYEVTDSSLEQEVIYNNLVVPRGGEFAITLSDGTIVYLNADSKLRFPVKFAEDVRMVELDGEGYFQVAKNESSPFTVKVGEMKVSVLGTEFNILGYKEYGEIQTTLVNGKVEVSSDKNKKNYTLLPGEQAVFNKKDGIIKVSKVDISYAIAWREGLLRFRDRPLREIMDVVARWYDIEIVYEDIEVKEYLFGCNFNRHETILPLLEVLESTGTVHFKIEEKKIIVSK